MTAGDQMLLGARRLRELLERHRVRPSKSLGQNFVIDPNTIRKVVRIAGIDDRDVVLEIGAGAGSLTLGLLQTGVRVVAVEVDPRLVAILEEVTGPFPHATVIHADALDLDLSGSAATKLVANLPYNAAATLVLKVLEEAPSIRGLTVMTQREVGERLVAGPGSKVYGVTSVLTAFHADAKIAGSVSRRAFYPQPNVDSVIVTLDRKQSPPGLEPGFFKLVVKTGFAQRRKTLRNALTHALGPVERVERALSVAGIGPSERAEDVSFARFVALTEGIAEPRR